MPPTVTVAAFVFEIVLLLAVIVGKEIKIVAVGNPGHRPGWLSDHLHTP
jgi:hypothetical protein